MFDFTTPSRSRRRRTAAAVEADKSQGFPIRLALIAAIIAVIVAIVFLDESNQYDPASERIRLESTLHSTRDSMQEVKTRRERIIALDKQADSDPSVIHNERLPPVWQLPATYSTVEEWHVAARRRTKRADEELKALTEREAQIATDIANLPPPSAKRVSVVRRVLNSILGELPKKED